MREQISFSQASALALPKMANGGVFLTSKHDNKVNTMTIGWGGINVYWGKQIFEAPVRFTRHTHPMITQSGVFTVSVPLDGEDMKKELAYCGSHSGSKEDKIEACGITLLDGQEVDCPIIAGCSLHFECKVLGKADLCGEDLANEVDGRWYKDKDYHTIFFGEIVACYLVK